MSSELIALIVVCLSFIGILFFVFRAVPRLKKMPEPEALFLKQELKDKIKEKTEEALKKNSNFVESFLHKLLSKVRILSLKIDKKTSEWIMKLRERSLTRTKDIDNYWKEIKASVKKKKG